MHPRLAELQSYLDRERANLDQALGELESSRHQERPAEGRWCATQVVEHLAIIDRRVATLLDGEIAKARQAGVGPDPSTDSVLGSIDAAKVIDRSQRYQNPRAEPQGVPSTEDALKSLDQARAGFKAMLRNADGVDLTKVVAPHPLFGPLNGYQWIAFTAAHMARHADQIREIARELS